MNYAPKFDEEASLKREEQEIADYTFGGEYCDGCSRSLPGIRFPVAPDYSEKRAYVERCSQCASIKSDVMAACIVGRMLGHAVKIDREDPHKSIYIDGLTFDEAEAIMTAIDEANEKLQPNVTCVRAVQP